MMLNMRIQYIRQSGVKSPAAIQTIAISAVFSTTGLYFFGQFPYAGRLTKWLGSALTKALSGMLTNTIRVPITSILLSIASRAVR